MSVHSEDVLEDLFQTYMYNARLGTRSDVGCFQSTQVNRFDVPDGTSIIQPDFPLSPLQCSAPFMPVTSDCNTELTSPTIDSAGRPCCHVEMVTVSAAHCRPTATVTDCSDVQVQLHVVSSQSSDATSLPSAVYDRVRNLFCMSGSETDHNRLSDTLSSSAASDAGKQNRHVDKLVTESNEIICTTAVSCDGDFSSLNSSYVDAGRMVYSEPDVNVLSKVSVVNAAVVPVMTTCVENNTSELHITNVCSLRNNVSMAALLEVTQSLQSPCQQTGVQSSFSSSNIKNAKVGDQNPIKKKLLSPTTAASVNSDLLSSCKRKRLSNKQKVCKSDALYGKTRKAKLASKKRRLYKHVMLLEDGIEEQSQPLDTNGNVSSCNDGLDAHMHRETDCETVVCGGKILTPVLVPAAVAVPMSLANYNETSNNPAVDSTNDAVTSSQNVVGVTAIESDAVRPILSVKTDVNTQCVTSLNHSMPVNEQSHVSLEQQMCNAECGQAVTAATNHSTESERRDVTATSSSSAQPHNDKLCTVSRSVATVSLLNPMIHIASAEWPRSVKSPFNSVPLTDDKRPSNCVVDKLLGNVERRTDTAAVENFQLAVADDHSLLHVTETHGKDIAVTKHTFGTETSSELLTVVASECSHSPMVRRDNNTLACSSSEHQTNDTIAGSSQQNCQKTSKVSGYVSLVTNKQDHSTSPVLLPTDVSHRLVQGTSVTTRATTSITDHNKNIVSVSYEVNDHDGFTSQTHSRESMGSSAGLRIPRQSKNESSSQSLLCGQKRSSGSYYLPNITASLSRLSSLGTPFPPSNSCSLQYKEGCRVTEESLGYRRSLTKADDISCARSDKDQLKQSERGSLGEIKTCSKVQSSRVVTSESEVCILADAASASGTETESKQSSVPSNGSNKLTLPTPKNSLTCYQPANSLPSVAPGSDSSLVPAATSIQPNYAVIQEILGLSTMSDFQRKIYTHQPPSDVEVHAFNHFRMLHETNHS